MVVLSFLSLGRLFATPGTLARPAPLYMGFRRQGYQSVFPFPSPVDDIVEEIFVSSPSPLHQILSCIFHVGKCQEFVFYDLYDTFISFHGRAWFNLGATVFCERQSPIFSNVLECGLSACSSLGYQR